MDLPIRAVIFDLGGVLIGIDWARYTSDVEAGRQQPVPYPHDYEQLNADLARFVSYLRPRYKIATICNGGSREATNGKFGLGSLVDLMIFDVEEGISKPDARIYQLTLARLHIQPQEAIFIDDKASNIEAAAQLGLHSILFRSTVQTITEIERLLQRY